MSFTLKFEKARERTPETRRDFENILIALLHDQWTYSTASGKPKEPSPLGKKFLDALQSAFDGGKKVQHQSWQAITADEWEAECAKRGLIDLDGKRNSARSLMSKYRRELIACGRGHAISATTRVWPL